MKINYKFSRKPKGVKGKILTPEDFQVEEIVDGRFLKKFERTENGIKRVDGPYALYSMTKRNLTTHNALKIISSCLKISENQIGYAGLKDKFALTKQYVTIKNGPAGDINLKDIQMTYISRTNRCMSIGDLIGNNFIIKLHDCRNLGKIERAVDSVKKNGLPNYFGPQRFGKYVNNHIIGRLIVKRKFTKAIRLINNIYGKRFEDLRDVNGQRIKFFINAYQSYIFNETLKCYIRKNKGRFSEKVKIVGCNTKLSKSYMDRIIADVINRERISPADFLINELRMSCSGSERPAFVDASNLDYEISENNLRLSFTLPKGSYATVLLEYL